MPTYDYVCKACDHRFEEFQSMSAKVLRTCPKCGKKSLERLIGIGAGVLFKGGGFYETDYRSDSYTKAAEAEKKSSEPKADAKPEGAKSESKSESTKPDTKSESASSKSDKADTPKVDKSKTGAKPDKPKKPGAKKSD